jgi:hypothetical protein
MVVGIDPMGGGGASAWKNKQGRWRPKALSQAAHVALEETEAGRAMPEPKFEATGVALGAFRLQNAMR